MAKKLYIGETADANSNVTTAKVQNSAGGLAVDADRGKPVKLVGDATFKICANGDAIEGFISSIENYTADAQAVGGVRFSGPKEAIISAAGWAIGNYVVADAQAADGTYNDANQFYRPKVKVGAAPSGGAAGDFPGGAHAWRIISVVVGTVGAAGAVVTISRPAFN